MEEKTSLIIGAFWNYNYNQLKPWVKSINECGFKGDKVVIAVNSTKETAEALIAEGFHVIAGQQNNNVPIHVARFHYIYEFLEKNWKKYKYVITTDVKDVIFQTDPVTWLSMYLGNKKIVAGSEAMVYEDEPWGNDNFLKCYGSQIHAKFKQNTIYNVGTLGGQSEYIKDLCLSIGLNGINRPIPVVDQAVFNLMVYTQPWKEITRFTSQEDGWACQAGTVADPSKIEAFRPHLLEGEPTFENGFVHTAKGMQFCIVHQYDRVPEWRKYYMEKYGQEDPAAYFNYRVQL